MWVINSFQNVMFCDLYGSVCYFSRMNSSVSNFLCRSKMLYFSLDFFFFKQKTEYEMRISDWGSDVFSSDLIRCVPSGMASNVIAYLAKANVALSVTITSIATMLGPLFTPVLMKTLAGEFIEIDIWKMMWDILKMVIMPIGIGLLFNQLLHCNTRWLEVFLLYVYIHVIAFSIVVVWHDAF